MSACASRRRSLARELRQRLVAGDRGGLAAAPAPRTQEASGSLRRRWRAPFRPASAGATRAIRRRDVDRDRRTMRPGKKLTLISGAAAFVAAPRSQWRDAFSATGPLTPKCVHSRRRVSRIATRPSTQTASSASCETPESSAVNPALRRARVSGTRPGVVATIVWPSRSANVVAGAVAAALRQRAAASREHDGVGAASAPCVSSSSKPRAVGPLDVRDAMVGEAASRRVRATSRSSASSTSRARFESGNSLPSRSSCRATPSSRKNATVSSTGNAAQHTAGRSSGGRPRNRSADDLGVGDVAAGAAADEDLRAGPCAPLRGARRCTPDSARRVKMAVARPAAPAPTIAMSQEGGRFSPAYTATFAGQPRHQERRWVLRRQPRASRRRSNARRTRCSG